MGWWFGRILTFELVADDEPPLIAAILADASAGSISARDSATVVGYAVYGQSIRAAVEPLVDAYGIELFDDGEILRSPGSGDPFLLEDQDFGNDADQQSSPRIQREQLPARSLPAVLRMTYYDPARDYQTGEARAAAGEQSGNELQRELPGVLAATAAKVLAEQMLARAWSQRDSMVLRLPPRRLVLEPGAKLQLAVTPFLWTVDKCTVDRFVVVVELRPATGAIAVMPALAGEAGRIMANADVVESPLSLTLVDAPDLSGASMAGPMVYLAATSSSPGWRRRIVEIGFCGQSATIATARRKSMLGRTMSVLGSSHCELLDLVNEVDVELVDTGQWLTSCDDDSLAAGTNLAVLGSELIQFGSVEPLGSGRFRLNRLLRGRGGTEWATGNHGTDEGFCMLRPDSLQPILLPDCARGATLSASGDGSQACQLAYGWESLRPPAPVMLSAAVQPNGDLTISWVRRSRRGWAWCDETDAPLGERVELYQVVLTGPEASSEYAPTDPELLVTAATAEFGSGSLTIEVRQIGDFGQSRSAQMSITLS